MNLTKIWLIAQQEFWSNLKRPSFLFAVFGTPILVALSIGLGVLTGSSEDDLGAYSPVGVLDRTEQQIFAQHVSPESFPDLFVWVTDEASAQQAVMDGELAGYLPAEFSVVPDALTFLMPAKYSQRAKEQPRNKQWTTSPTL